MRAVLFDLDGTLLDSIGLILASFRHTAERHLDVVPSDGHWLATIGQPLLTQLAPLAGSDEHLHAMRATYSEYFIAHHDEHVRAFPGVREAVDRLAQRGVQMGIVSGKVRRGIDRGLRHTGLDVYFEVRVGADDLEEHKPHPAPLLRALHELGATGGTYVGDAPGDIEAARRAKLEAVAVAWGPFDRETLEAARPDRWLETPEAIAELAAESSG